MKYLFTSECRRFRNAALVAFAVHCLIQLLASRLSEPLQMHWQQVAPYPLLCAVAGLAFAMVQFGSYRQGSRWMWLLHRPLPRSRIFGALSLTALTLIAAGIGLPILLAVLGTDIFTGRTVDTRHYMIPLHMVLVSLIAWFAGAYLMLCGRRSSWAVLLVPGVLMGHLASGGALLVPALLCTAMMAALAYTAFAPDRTAPPGTATGLLAAAIPLQLGFYLVMLWGGSMLFQSGQMLFGVHPLNRTVPPAGGYAELIRMDGRSAILRGLQESKDPRAAPWRRQVALTDVGDIRPVGRAHPVRHQIANLDRTQWSDSERGIRWTFNHDRMLFEGRDAYTDAPRGWYGMGGMNDLRPFPAVPVMPPLSILTRQHLLMPGADPAKVGRMITVSGAESLSGPATQLGLQRFSVTNQRLLAYRQPSHANAPFEQLYSVALPAPFSDLDRIHIARLLDGTLLSFNYGRRMADGHSGSSQHLLFVDQDGKASTVAVRALDHDFPLLFEHKDWWLSPVSHALFALPERLLDKGTIADVPGTVEPARPPGVIAAALVAALLSAALAWWRLRHALPRSRLAWSGAALLLGPPCLVCLWVLLPRTPRIAAIPEAAPLPALA